MSAERQLDHPPAAGGDRTVVLLVEDDQNIVDLVRSNLIARSHDVIVSKDGRDALDLLTGHRPDAVLLDLMLPGIDGFELCRELRERSSVGILVLSARRAETDKVRALNLGADDYMTKPFSMRELVARIRAQLRRAAKSGALAEANEVLRGGPIELDIDAHQARVDGEPVDLRPKEFELLESLMRRRNRLAARHTLIDEVWGPSYFGDTKTLDVHIKRLRQKLEADPSSPQVIVTVRGLGYKFVDEQ